MGRKKREARKERVSVNSARAQLLEGDVRARALECGLVLRVSAMRAGRTEMTHWMFETEDGERVLNYWPSNGKVWAPATNFKGTVADPWAALEEAKRLPHHGKPKAAPLQPAPLKAPPPVATSPKPFVGWVLPEGETVWQRVCGGLTEAACFQELRWRTGADRRPGTRRFVTRGRSPDEVFQQTGVTG